MFIKNKYAFTLIELIIVVVILAILATIAFLTLWNYPTQARDTLRMTDLRNIEKAIELYKVKNWTYPKNNINNNFEKIFWESNFLEVWLLNTLPKDPITKKEYFYEADKNFYKLEAILEKWEKFILTNKYLFSSCKELLKNKPDTKSWNYSILVNNVEVPVYCDMETTNWDNDKWWTRYLNIKWNYTLEDAKKCWTGEIISNDKIDCFNPNVFWMRAEKFMLKENWKKYFYKNNEPEPNINSIHSITWAWEHGVCHWWNYYMTVYDHNQYNKDISNIRWVSLWLSLCRSGGQKWSIQHSMEKVKYMNFTSIREPLWEPAISYSPSRWEDNVNPIEIYIK